jgi:hypothetical protein
MCIYCGTTKYRKIYEQHNGPIPKDESGRTYDIHHIDGNRTNNHPVNLVAVSIAEHYQIHKAQKDWGACWKLHPLLKLSPTEISNIVRQSSLQQVKRGTHPWLKRPDGSSLSQSIVKKQIDDGLHASQIKKTCPHCGITMDSANYAKHHGENCGKPKDPNYVPHNSGDNHYSKKPEYAGRYAGKNNPGYDHTIYNWENINTKEQIDCTRYDMAVKLSCHRCNVTAVLNGNNKTVFGWKLR